MARQVDAGQASSFTAGSVWAGSYVWYTTRLTYGKNSCLVEELKWP